jgi:hypothetical protein
MRVSGDGTQKRPDGGRLGISKSALIGGINAEMSKA